MENKVNDKKEIVFEGKDRAVQQDWDVYWSEQDKASNKTYDVFANFYRNNIIKRGLNYFIFKHFTKGQNLSYY